MSTMFGVIVLGLWFWATGIYGSRPSTPTGELAHPIHFFGVIHYGLEAERWVFLAAWWTGGLWVVWCLARSFLDRRPMDDS